MPLPKTSNIGKIMRVLKKEGGRSHKQMIAIALSHARKYGAKIKKYDKDTVKMALRMRGKK